MSRLKNVGYMTPEEIKQQITGLILAGGQGTRMGGADKGLVNFNGRPMVKIVLETLEESLTHIIINANRNLGLYQDFGYPVVVDSEDNFAGPLAGIQNGLEKIVTPYAFIVPCDAPNIQMSILQRLLRALQTHGAEVAVAEVNGRAEPVITLMKTTLSHSIALFLQAGGRKTSDWVLNQHTIAVDFSDHPEWFVNINSPEDQAQAVP